MTSAAAPRASERRAPVRMIEPSIVDLLVGDRSGGRSCCAPRLRTPRRCSLVSRGSRSGSRLAPSRGSILDGTRHDAVMHHSIATTAIRAAAARAFAVGLTVATAASLVGAAHAAAAIPPDFPSYDAGYHTYAEMVTEIKAAQTAHPDIVQVRSIGKSYQGRDIWVAKAPDNVAVEDNEPAVMFDSMHHAREHLSLEQ